MTIDERIERLTARHEALAETVQMLAIDIQQLTANQDRLQASQEKFQASQEKYQRDNQILLHEMMVAITRLANTGAAHNAALEDHEKRIENLEKGKGDERSGPDAPVLES